MGEIIRVNALLCFKSGAITETQYNKILERMEPSKSVDGSFEDIKRILETE